MPVKLKAKRKKDHWVELKFHIDALAASQLAQLKDKTGESTASYLRGLIDRAMIVEGICPGPTRPADEGLKRAWKVRSGNPNPAEARAAQVEKAGIEDQARIGAEIDKALLDILKERPEILKELDAKALANLAVSRSPKPKDDDGELRSGVNSLREMLEGLPDVEDLTRKCADLQLEINTLKARIPTEEF